MNRKVGLASLAALCATLHGCGNLPPVQAWEKGTLARPEMGFGQPGMRGDQHIYSSRETAPGGGAIGGGGCGCN